MKIPDIFPQKTSEDKRILGLLQKSYRDFRYKEVHIEIAKEDLTMLLSQIKTVEDLLKKVVNNSINYYS